MNILDVVNGIFELGGAVMTWANAYKLHKDKMISGVYWPVWVFLTAWGLWNLYYYPNLDQWLSFYAGIFLVSGNIAWLCLAVRYR